MDIAHNPVQHTITRHIDVNMYMIKEKLDNGIAMPLSNRMIDIINKKLLLQ